MTHLLVLGLFVPGLFVASGLLLLAARAIEDTAHRMRGDVRCGPDCPCRGTRPVARG